MHDYYIMLELIALCDLSCFVLSTRRVNVVFNSTLFGSQLLLCATTFVLSANVSAQANAGNEPKTLISVHLVELDSQNDPIEKKRLTHQFAYRLINEETQKIETVFQTCEAEIIYLAPAYYGF
jgi:hypothetical protein